MYYNQTMASKSAIKRQLILKGARQLFCERGFCDVTMKDIVDACGISRGGLYLYFNNTGDIFLEVLRLESQDSDEVYGSAVSDGASTAKIIGFFLKEQKKEILQMTDSLTVATYEYFFKHKIPRDMNPIRHSYDAAVLVLTGLIRRGIENGEFYECDPKAAARNIMFVIEGMKVAARTMDIDQKMVDQQLMYIVDTLMVQD